MSKIRDMKTTRFTADAKKSKKRLGTAVMIYVRDDVLIPLDLQVANDRSTRPRFIIGMLEDRFGLTLRKKRNKK